MSGAHVLRIETTDDRGVVDAVREVTADLVTVTTRQVLLWREGAQVAAVEIASLGSIGFADNAWSLEQARSEHANAYHRWTREDDERLLLLYDRGESVEALARLFERKPSAITSRLGKLGALPPAYQEEDVPAPIRGRHEASPGAV